MLATAHTKPAPLRRARLIIVAALLAISLGLGIATTEQRVNAATTVCYLDPGLGRVCQVGK
jgi:hypothetical protein